MMLRRSILGALTIVAGIGAALAVKYLSDSEKQVDDERDLFDGDDEVHFIHINDDTSSPEEVEEDYEAEIPPFRAEAPVKEEEVEETLDSDVKEICAVYAYLEPVFVKALLDKNDELDADYPEGTLVSISHAMKFDDEEAGETFQKIADDNGYVCSKVGLTIKATKKLFTQSGAIISDVLNVSNQAKALGGDYLEYTIE